MAFTSQYEKSRLLSRRSSSSDVVMTQSYKPSTKSEEMSIRVSVALLKKVGIEIGDKVDVLRDKDDDLWMIRGSGDKGFLISGKPDAPMGLIRYTLKDGHEKITKERSELPVRLEFDEECIILDNKSIIFGKKTSK